MSQLSFRHLWKALSTGTLVGVGLLLAGPNCPARAGPILDPLGDFLPTYTGPQDPGLDVLAHEVTLVGDRLNFFGRMAGPISPTQAIGGLYLFGVDRGQGTPRFLAGTPVIGPNVRWDLIVRINPDGTGLVNNQVAGVVTPLNLADISISGNELTASVPLSLLSPAATLPPEQWTYNLWPRNGIVIGQNVNVSDLAPDDGNSPVHAIPEPVSLTMCAIGAFGLLGCRWRRRRHTARELVARRQRKQNPITKYWTFLVAASLATLLALFAPALVARADIFQWEYINPADPSLGKQPSTMLAPDGAGVSAVLGADLSNRNLTMAYLIGANLMGSNLTNTNLAGYEYYQSADLTGANLSQANLTNAHFQSAHLLGGEYNYANGANLTNADLSQANLTNANFSGEFVLYEDTGYIVPGADLTGANLSGAQSLGASFTYATLTGANLAGAEVRGAGFSYSAITAAQLYSTASYQAHDLTGIDLSYNDLTGVNLAGQNLTNAGFYQSSLANADLSQANLTNAGFYRAYLDNANLAQANLTNANFQYARLINANLSHVNLTGAKFSQNSYDYDNLFAYSSALLIGANLSHANLTNADFSGWEYSELSIFYGANLSNANLSGADARGANFYLATLTGANTNNLIQSNGHIAGLDLTTSASLVVRDYDGNPAAPPVSPLPIVVEQHLAMDATGTLQLVFDADPWDSTISFALGIPVTLGGTLDLTFAPGVDVATQSGRTIDLFDWTGVDPTGAFSVSSPFAWDLTQLYTSGEVTLAAVMEFVTGDLDLDGDVDFDDIDEFVLGLSNPQQYEDIFGVSPSLRGDTDDDGDLDFDDIDNFVAILSAPASTGLQSVPEPSAAALLCVGASVLGLCRRRHRTCSSARPFSG